MKIYRTYLIILVGLLISLQSLAQNPGYMGKHFIISGEMAFSGKGFWFQKTDFTTWTKFGGRAEAIVGANSIFGFSYLHYKNVLNINYTDNYFDYSNPTLVSHTFAINYTLFPRYSIAPLGYFTRFELGYIVNNVPDYYENGVPRQGIDPTSFVGYSSHKLQANNLLFDVTFGYKRIIADRIIISLGAQFGITLRTGTDIQEIGDIVSLGEVPKSVFNQNFRSNLIAFRLSIGGLW
ncbi:MAG TPA: hypothetical protein ENK66_09845 [Arcobacter sp.]|jgi:hypothetical protein|nr:hypothetical protein [Arcobacter sp.]